MDAIFKRRSVRNFIDKCISTEQIEKMLKAAMQAPSACNKQPWEFIVLTGTEIKNKIADTHPYAKMVKDAACAIIVCANLDAQNDVSADYFPQDCAAATQNILLQAYNLGLGAVWCGVYPKEERIAEVRKVIDMPDNIVPFNVIAIGYTNNYPMPVDRYDISKVHFEKW